MTIPHHLAIIMDGNGRWAKKRFLPRVVGHQAGKETVDRMVEVCSNKGIKTLSLFAFSTENWQRPEQEVALLMRLIEQTIQEKKQKFMDNNIRVNILGERQNLSPNLIQAIEDLEALTANNQGMNLVLAINYSGLWSIQQTIKNIIQKGLNPDEIDVETFNAHRPLPTLPPVDLLIRTSGEQRISNFHLWELAYAELFFSDVLWPDFSEKDLDEALASYQKRNRRYGGLDESK